MDETVKPLRIPPEMAIYAEKHEIFDLLQYLIRNLLVDKPEDPIRYLIGLLKRDNTEVPRVMLLGPPASGKTTIAKMLCESTQAVHLTASSILMDSADLAIEEYTEQSQQVPRELWVKMIQQRLSKVDCVRRGWILEGIPISREEALSLQEAGIAPEHVVMLEAPDAVLMERSLGKKIDPVTGDVYHVTFIRPENIEVTRRLEGPVPPPTEELVARSLVEYHRESHALERTYQNCVKVIDADQPHVDVFAQALRFVLSRHRSAAPHTPRILLFGPPGSGKSLQARLLAQKYKIINICCGKLLKAVAADESSMGQLIKPYLESGEQVPDSMVQQILTGRLSQLDCTTHGWILHGYPRDTEQAERLHESNFIPSRVFFLEMTDDTAIERLTLRSVDPVTGDRYHSLYKAAPSPEVRARLRTDPKDSETAVLRRLREYGSRVSGLQAFYPDAVHLNADQDPHTVFEALESRLVGRLPKQLPN
ncbi:adenylate kinase 8 [Chanos chanos]|uniref:Adenylate kinase 8 n=1 Tax=Chanos chanos TaxID=29144 RepID=A0A6J2WUC2_CHACN|nr:adenylate kinase 8 [Chanos chanos]